MHVLQQFWNDIGIPIWPNLVASLIVWLFLRFQTAAIKEEHRLAEERHQQRHAEILAIAAASGTTVVNNPEEVKIITPE